MPTSSDNTKYGLKESTIAEIEQVILCGSRTMGTYRNGSDIDITIKGDSVTHSQLLRIENRLDDLLLPYTIDLSLLRQIDNNELLDHIRRVVGVMFYERKQP